MQGKEIQTLVPVELLKNSTSTTSHPEIKEKQLAATVHIGNTKLALYNGMDKYILYAILKELKQ